MISSLINRVLLLLLFAGSFLLPGCASQKAAESIEPAKNATIFVEGRHRGVTPATINVFRNLGEYRVTLMQGETIVRRFELRLGGEQRSPERHIIDMDLERDHGGIGLRTFGLDDFETANDTLFVIPYVANPIAIDDVEYGFTLVISD